MWIGLQSMYLLTNDRNYTLRVKIYNFDGSNKTAYYTNFRIVENVRMYVAFLYFSFPFAQKKIDLSVTTPSTKFSG